MKQQEWRVLHRKNLRLLIVRIHMVQNLFRYNRDCRNTTQIYQLFSDSALLSEIIKNIS